MRICFTAKTNKDYVMINTAVFQLKCGIRVTVDRDRTEWGIEDGKLAMEWRECYLWEVNDIGVFDAPAYLNEYGAELFEGAKLVELNLEDDADSDYEVTDIEFFIS